MLVGSHLSVAGGLHLAVEEVQRLGLDCVQVFTKNQRQWKVRPLQAEEIAAFKAAVKAAGWDVHPERRLVSHNSYLVNLASPDATNRARSVDLQRHELERCEALGIPSCVMHPGAHLGEKGNAADEEAGLRRLAASLDQLHADLPGYATVTCLENTVGAGTNLGGPFEHLRRVLDLVKQPERVAVCFDTCHASAFGHDMRTPAAAAAVWETLRSKVGKKAVRVLHVNDSKGDVGSHLDRHEHLGNGLCGKACFEQIARDPLLQQVPFIMETPKEGKLRRQDPDRANAAWLRACAMLALVVGATLLLPGCRPWSKPAGEYAATSQNLAADQPTPEQQARLDAARDVADRGDYQAALGEFRQVLAESPRLPQAHVAKAEAEQAAGDPRAAEASYLDAIKLDPRNVDARMGLAMLYMGTNRLTEAMREYQQVLVDQPGSMAALRGMVDALTRRDQLAMAVPYLRQITQSPEARPSDWTQLGRALLAANQPTEAASVLEEVLTMVPPEPGILGPLTQAYTAEARYGEAASTAEELARRWPSALAWERVGWLQFRQGDYVRSAAAYRRAADLEPTSARSWNGVAVTALNTWLLSDRLDQAAREEARRALNRSLELDPNQPAMLRLQQQYRP